MSNPIDLIKTFMGRGGNPQQLLNMFLQNNSNPMISNLMQMAQNNNPQAVENFARNFCKERGIDYDTEFPKFINQLK